MVEIKAGPELDRAVAEAIGDEPGLPFSIARADRGEEGFTYRPCSTDLNAAFAAAEKVGLFDYHAAELDWEDGRWYVQWLVDPGHGGLGDSAVATTPALAICAGILELKEAK